MVAHTVTTAPGATNALIGHLQLECLKALWKHGGTGTVKEVHGDLCDSRTKAGQPVIAYTTVLTVLRNLRNRKIVKQERDISLCRAHRFTALYSEPQFLRQTAQHFIGGFFEGDLQKLLAAVK